jgi:transglutaminase-like putative cysteine protease
VSRIGSSASTLAVPLRLAFGRGLGTGATASVLALDPMRLTLEPLRAVVAAESVFVVTDSAAIDPATGEWTPALLDTLLGWRIVEAGGRASRWVDAEGYPLSARTTEGLALERSAFEIVNSAYRADRADSVWISRGLRPRGVLARAPRSARMPLVADSGFALAGDPAIGGALRRWQGDTLQLGTAADTSPSRPAPTDRSAGPFVPSEDARVAAQARRVIGRLRGEAAVSQLMDWVVTEVALDERGPTGALAALEQHRGTAEAKVALFTALARAAGFPARLVGGVALGADGHWYRHTWSEVLLRGAWVGADPVFGRYPADAAYVRLTTGRPGHVLAVDPIAARLTPLSEPR